MPTCGTGHQSNLWPDLGIFLVPSLLAGPTAFFSPASFLPLLSELGSLGRDRALGSGITRIPLPSSVWLTALVPGAMTVTSSGPATGAQSLHRLGFALRLLSLQPTRPPAAGRGLHPAFRMPVAMTNLLSGRAPLLWGVSLLRTLSPCPFPTLAV